MVPFPSLKIRSRVVDIHIARCGYSKYNSNFTHGTHQYQYVGVRKIFSPSSMGEKYKKTDANQKSSRSEKQIERWGQGRRDARGRTSGGMEIVSHVGIEIVSSGGIEIVSRFYATLALIVLNHGL